MLTVINNRSESKKAFDLLRQKLSRGKKINRIIGTKDGSAEHDIRWHDDEEIWTLLTEGDSLPRFWCCYGLENPKNKKALNVTVEINPPHEWKNLSTAGMFARDKQGSVYLCHTGRIGGGKPGVGKNNFLERYRGKNFVEVDIHKKMPISMINLGPISSPNLLSEIAHFVREVGRFKDEITTGVPHYPSRIGSFRPEFSGPRKVGTRKKAVASYASHGLVVGELANAITKIGLTPFNDQQRDLFLTNRNNQMTTLFEVKTSVETTDIYQAVGQLMLNGQAQQRNVKRVLVVPGKPSNKSTQQALSNLKINVISYRWGKMKPVIPSLKKLLYP